MDDSGVAVSKGLLVQRRSIGLCFDRSVDVHVSNLRKKLAKVGGENSFSVRGRGYQFVS